MPGRDAAEPLGAAVLTSEDPTARRLRAVRAAAAIDLTAELEASRRRLVAARDAERRRIERDLHDGAQQRLVGLRVTLAIAADRLRDERADLAAMLDDLGVEVDSVIDDIRTLAQGIFPPLLASSGLGAALEAACRRAPVPARLVTRQLARYARDIESAVYFCCLEAMHNSAKHGGPSVAIVVRVWQERAELRFEVGDTGAGFDPERTGHGMGLTDMRDRIGALGGTLAVHSDPSLGTRVSGSIPLVRDSAAAA